MRKIIRFVSVYFLMSALLSCATSAFITDSESVERQHAMQKSRTGAGFAQVGLVFAGAAGELLTGVNIYPELVPQSYKKMKLANRSADTLYVNMVTDWLWKDSTYCDIREIEIPPLQSAKVIVPVGAAYNIFFRKNYNDPDDEKVEVNTSDVRRVKLKPGKLTSGEISGN